MASPPLLTQRIVDAFELTVEVHGSKVKKGTDIPYLAHLLGVTSLVLEHGGDEDCAMAALLHDAVEDGEDGKVIQDRIRRKFGNRVAGIVLGCSDTVAEAGKLKPSWRPRKERYLKLLAQETDRDVLLVSICDKIYNTGLIVADVKRDGPAVWRRFNAPPEDLVWYYTALARCYPKLNVSGELCQELSLRVCELVRLALTGSLGDTLPAS